MMMLICERHRQGMVKRTGRRAILSSQRQVPPYPCSRNHSVSARGRERKREREGGRERCYGKGEGNISVDVVGCLVFAT